MDSNSLALVIAVVAILGAAAAPKAAAQSFCEPVPAETLVAPVVLGNGMPGSVTTAQIQAALDAGGHIRFDLGAAPTTLVVTSTLTASRETVLDGGGVVTLSGGDVRRILRIVNPNPAPNAPLFRVTLQNIAFADARIIDGRGAAIYKQHDFEFPLGATVAIPMASPARELGVSGAEVPPTDQRLLPRVGAPDSGAYEFGAEGIILRDGFE
jgi:hypothetical protein